MKNKTEKPNALAIHANDGDSHVVGIGNLRVIVCEQGGIWFAQGLEIDYAADGKSLDEVKKNFEHGLSATVGLHLQAFNSIENLLTPAPPAMWKELNEIKKRFRFSQVSVHEFEDDNEGFHVLPYPGISYFERGSGIAA